MSGGSTGAEPCLTLIPQCHDSILLEETQAGHHASIRVSPDMCILQMKSIIHRQYGNTLNNVQKHNPYILTERTSDWPAYSRTEALRAARQPVQGWLGFNLFDVPRPIREIIVFGERCFSTFPWCSLLQPVQSRLTKREALSVDMKVIHVPQLPTHQLLHLLNACSSCRAPRHTPRPCSLITML